MSLAEEVGRFLREGLPSGEQGARGMFTVAVVLVAASHWLGPFPDAPYLTVSIGDAAMAYVLGNTLGMGGWLRRRLGSETPGRALECHTCGDRMHPVSHACETCGSTHVHGDRVREALPD